jgi:hypothetical protein
MLSALRYGRRLRKPKAPEVGGISIQEPGIALYMYVKLCQAMVVESFQRA